MSEADQNYPAEDGPAWDILSIVFWVTVFVILVYTTANSKIPFGPKIMQAEPWLLAVSIITTVIFSYLFIFVRTLISLGQYKLATIFLAFVVAILVIVGVLLCFELGKIFYDEAIVAYPTNIALPSASSNFDILSFFHRNHALVIVGILTLVDSLIAIMANIQNKKEIMIRFVRLIAIIDLPTLVAFGAIIYIRDIWIFEWKGIVHGTRFEAGAITFQLLAANISIVMASLFYKYQQALPSNDESPTPPTKHRGSKRG